MKYQCKREVGFNTRGVEIVKGTAVFVANLNFRAGGASCGCGCKSLHSAVI